MKIEKQALDTLVHHQLRNEILSGALAAGARLVQEEIASRFGVSRIPVRDALRLLEGDGLVERGGVGYTVAELGEQGLADMFGLRLRIEGFAAALCARRVTPELITELEEIIGRCEQAVTANDLDGFTKLDKTFHEAIYAGTNSAQVKKCVFLLWNGGAPVAAMHVHPQRLVAAHKEHQRIFEAIRMGDHLKAEEEARIHVDRARSAILSKGAGAYDLYNNRGA